MKSLYMLVIVVLLAGLAGCNVLSPAAPSTTPQPILPAATLPPASTRPPVVVLSPTPAQAVTTALPAATATKAAPVPTAPPTLAATATRLAASPTAAQTVPAGFPQQPEAILILDPGLTSAIISPVSISGEADSTFEQNLVAKVTGENGLMIASTATTIQAELGKRGPFKVLLPFKISNDQPGRVAVYSTSPKDGGLIHFTSLEVTLKASGGASLKAGAQANEILVITSPGAGATASGGTLHVEGWSGPVFENTLVVVLCGEGGSAKLDPFCGTVDNVLARKSVLIAAPDVGQPGSFSVDLAFKVSQAVSGRVAVYFTSPRDGGLLHLTSLPVRLQP